MRFRPAILISPAVCFAAIASPGSFAKLSAQDSGREVASAGGQLLLACGLPGDDEHRERLTRACRQILQHAGDVLPVDRDKLIFLAGDEQMLQELADLSSKAEVCTRESIERSLAAVSANNPAQTTVWIILLGHGSYYNGLSQYNVLGPDVDADSLATSLTKLGDRPSVLWLTFPTSGFWLAPLASSSRITITATEPDLEYTGTEMPYALADLLAGDPQEAELTDIDQDDRLTLLDLYLACNLEITGRFKTLERLQTEHAQLDDNGDGRGSEVQAAYLPVVDEGEETNPKVDVITDRSRDGYRSRQLPLLQQPSAQ